MIVIAKVKVQTGKESEFEEIFKRMISQVEKEPGTLVYKLVQSTDDSTEYTVIEEYKNREALDFHLNTSYFKEIGQLLGPITTGPPNIETFIEKGAIKRQ